MPFDTIIPIRPWAKDSPPWSFCGDKAGPDFGTLWAEPAARGSTILYFDRERRHHAMTVYDRCVGGVVELEGRRWTVRRLDAGRLAPIVIDRGTPGEFTTTLGEFLDDNAAPGVDPLEPEEIAALERAIAARQPYAIGWFIVEAL